MAAAAHAGGAAALAAAPARQVTDNAVMHARLLEALHAQGVQRVVWIGSVTLYQEFEGAIREDALDLNQDPPASHFGVGWVMRFSEKLCQFWRAQGGMAIINIRSANVFGPYARFDPRGSNFIPALIRKAVDRMDPFEVWGSPDVARDVIYAADFARAVGLLLTDDAIPGGVFNVGSGAPVTVGQVVEWALRSAGHAPSEIRYRDDRPTTIRFRSLDCSRIRAATGWAPQHTVEEGIRLTTDWWMRNKDWWTK
jgi:GDP-L-fucose synthase